MANPNSAESYSITNLFEGGSGEDHLGIFTRRVTYGVMNPQATHGVRVQTERSFVQNGSDLDTRATFRLLTQYIGKGLAFNEGRDGFDDVVSGHVHAKIRVDDLAINSVHTMNGAELTDHQIRDIAQFVGYQAIQLGGQLNEIMGNQQ